MKRDGDLVHPAPFAFASIRRLCPTLRGELPHVCSSCIPRNFLEIAPIPCCGLVIDKKSDQFILIGLSPEGFPFIRIPN
jgi:hypothetical protein